LQNNESFQKVYEFVNSKSYKEKRTVTPNPSSKKYENYEGSSLAIFLSKINLIFFIIEVFKTD